jgi:hypothetical protein
MSPESVQRRVHFLSDELRNGHLERGKFSEFRRELIPGGPVTSFLFRCCM